MIAKILTIRMYFIGLKNINKICYCSGVILKKVQNFNNFQQGKTGK